MFTRHVVLFKMILGNCMNLIFPQTVFCWGSPFFLKKVSGSVQVVVSGSPDVGNSFVSPASYSFPKKYGQTWGSYGKG